MSLVLFSRGCNYENNCIFCSSECFHGNRTLDFWFYIKVAALSQRQKVGQMTRPLLGAVALQILLNLYGRAAVLESW